MYMHVCVYIYIYIYIYIHISVYICIHIHVILYNSILYHVCIYTCTNIYYVYTIYVRFFPHAQLTPAFRFGAVPGWRYLSKVTSLIRPHSLYDLGFVRRVKGHQTLLHRSPISKK